MKFLTILLALAANAFAADRPNILFIMTDDHAAHAISCYGSKVNETPNLDRLAKSGVRFTNAFVTNSICTPSRATLLTGKYSHLNGVPVFNNFDGSQQNVAKLLQSAGYHTGVIGKWHLGSDPTGFDRWIILPGQGVYNNPAFLTPAGRLTVNGYVTDIITDLGTEWLDTRPKDKPFFLLLHHKAPHREWTPSEKYRAEFSKKTIPEPPTLFDKYDSRPAALPENRQTIARDLNRNDLKMDPPNDIAGDALTRWKYQRYMQDYLACVQSVDDSVGKVLDYLAAHDLAKNTLVIYTTDNGPMVCLYPDSATTPFRGEKNTNWDGGWRVPALIRWPGVVKPGTLFTDIVAGEDWLPTLVAAAGDPGVTDRLLKGDTIGDRTYKVHLDGYNQMDYLAGKAPGARNDFFYFSDDGDLLAVRYQSLKVHFMIQEATGIDVWRHPFTTLRAPIFFDLAIDPCERGQEGINYNDWWYRRTFLALPMKDIVGKMLMTFREFPPRQKPASFTIDQALMGLQKSAPPTK